ncbi:MAG: aromatic ring-hydroxylating dioxygenase subunit alpha [Devosia sp.]|nr:aromatic ring-hydroxylating dioxygenase subunit alpha [Devosia sp.]
MFSAAKSASPVSDFPKGSNFAESDWHILAGFWHPVAYSHEIGDKPVGARLLDVNLVMFRTTEGLSVARDICPHRGTRLSGGWIAGDQLVCPMHGLHFAADGRCTRIPAMGDQQRIPARLRLQSYLVEERYGIVWTCLKPEPIRALPEWRGIGETELKKVFVPKDTWYAAASRHVENFNDVAHFPWVHVASFGGDREAAVPAYDVERTAAGLSFAFPYREGFNRFADGIPGSNRDVVYTYELTYPFSTLIVIEPTDSPMRFYFADAASPVSAHETRIFQVLTDTSGNPDPAYWIRDSLVINYEDKPMVEGQRPEDLPLDLTVEMHIPADRMSLEYRRGLVELFGLGAPIAS